MFFKKKPRSKLLMKYIKINFLVIFLPIAISSVIYCISIQKNYEEKYLDTMEYSVNEKMWQLETRLKSFASTAQRISLDKDFTPYQLTTSSYTAVETIKRLKAFSVESIYFQELAIYLNDSDKLYTSNGVVDIDTFMERTYQPSAEFSREEYLELISGKRYYGCTTEGQYVLSGAREYNLVTYPLGKTGGSAYGTLIGIYENDWEEIFETEASGNKDRLVIVCTESMEPLYTQMAEKIRGNLGQEADFQEPLSELLKSWNTGEDYYEFTLGGVEFVGKISHSDVNGWYLIEMVEKHVVSSGLLMMQLPMLIVIFLCLLLLTIFLSITLSVYNYRPIQRLYNLFDKKDEKDELLFLNEYIRKLIEEQNDMGEQLNASMKISRMELVRRLLRSSLDVSLPAVKNQLSNVGIHLDKEYLAAIVIRFSEEARKDFGMKLKSALYESKYSGFYLTERIYKNYDGFLACVEKQEEITEFVEWLIEQLGEDVELKVGVGNSYRAAESLKYSLMEATIAVEGKEEKLVFFSNMATRRRGEFYCKPLESELRLKQLLLQGAAENLDEVLNELHRELLSIWQSSSDTVLFFLTNRILNALFENAVSLKDSMWEKYLHYTNLDEFLERLREFCRLELNCQLERKMSQEDQRMKNILRFIDENFMRQEMSLVWVAEEFDMTGPYLSKIFKSAMGRNFIDYVTEKRLELAAQLLVETDDAIGEIVAKVGYSDAASFTRKFSRHFLVSPGNYRKKERENRKLKQV